VFLLQRVQDECRLLLLMLLQKQTHAFDRFFHETSNVREVHNVNNQNELEVQTTASVQDWQSVDEPCSK